MALDRSTAVPPGHAATATVAAPLPRPRAHPAERPLLAERVRPVALAGEQLLAVLPALVTLLPDEGLRRGSVVAVDGPGASTSLGLALAAGASQAGSWVAGVGLTSLGVVAAAELGVVLHRLALVATPPSATWATVVAALVDAFDVVLLGPVAVGRPAGEARRLAARARERGAVLVGLGPLGALSADVRLTVTETSWEGAGQGHGHLRARRVVVESSGRGRASRLRRTALWLPDGEGRISLAQPVAPSRQHTPRPAAPAWQRVG